jgi:hypothetical protein
VGRCLGAAEEAAAVGRQRRSKDSAACDPTHCPFLAPHLRPQEDPALLFEPVESLEVGLRRMYELWPGLTPSTLADSEPLHLSLAVKALGLTGPPKGF